MVTICALNSNFFWISSWVWSTNCCRYILFKLYIPLSAELGNAISNDGDALFPAIALAPKAAILATFYSAFPAIIVAYTYMIFFEL